MAQRSKFGEVKASNKFWVPQAVTRSLSEIIKLIKYADVAELADALDSGSSES